ncbi:13735_t:CDS:2 [Entrophospora sp. SA101]|nr:13735_t:CDS:2 [Entrophospora sp. SA101]
MEIAMLINMIMMDMIMYVYEENNNSNIDRSEGIPKDTCPTKVKREVRSPIVLSESHYTDNPDARCSAYINNLDERRCEFLFIKISFGPFSPEESHTREDRLRLDEYGLKYFEDYGSIKFIEIIGIGHCVGFLSFRPPNRKTEIIV